MLRFCALPKFVFVLWLQKHIILSSMLKFWTICTMKFTIMSNISNSMYNEIHYSVKYCKFNIMTFQKLYFDFINLIFFNEASLVLTWLISFDVTDIKQASVICLQILPLLMEAIPWQLSLHFFVHVQQNLGLKWEKLI